MMKVIDVVSKRENRNQYAYILNHEFGLFAGRVSDSLEPAQRTNLKRTWRNELLPER
jgi:hypothetical protein